MSSQSSEPIRPIHTFDVHHKLGLGLLNNQLISALLNDLGIDIEGVGNKVIAAEHLLNIFWNSGRIAEANGPSCDNAARI